MSKQKFLKVLTHRNKQSKYKKMTMVRKATAFILALGLGLGTIAPTYAKAKEIVKEDQTIPIQLNDEYQLLNSNDEINTTDSEVGLGEEIEDMISAIETEDFTVPITADYKKAEELFARNYLSKYDELKAKGVEVVYHYIAGSNWVEVTPAYISVSFKLDGQTSPQYHKYNISNEVMLGEEEIKHDVVYFTGEEDRVTQFAEDLVLQAIRIEDSNEYTISSKGDTNGVSVTLSKKGTEETQTFEFSKKDLYNIDYFNFSDFVFGVSEDTEIYRRDITSVVYTHKESERKYRRLKREGYDLTVNKETNKIELFRNGLGVIREIGNFNLVVGQETQYTFDPQDAIEWNKSPNKNFPELKYQHYNYYKENTDEAINQTIDDKAKLALNSLFEKAQGYGSSMNIAEIWFDIDNELTIQVNAISLLRYTLPEDYSITRNTVTTELLKDSNYAKAIIEEVTSIKELEYLKEIVEEEDETAKFFLSFGKITDNKGTVSLMIKNDIGEYKVGVFGINEVPTIEDDNNGDNGDGDIDDDDVKPNPPVDTPTDKPTDEPEDKPDTDTPTDKPDTDKPTEKPDTDKPTVETDSDKQLDTKVEVIESVKTLTLKGETAVKGDGSKESKYGITSEVVNKLKDTNKEIVLTDGTTGTSLVLNNKCIDIDSLKAKLGSDISLQVSLVTNANKTFRLDVTAIGKDLKLKVKSFGSQVRVTFELQPTAKAMEKTADVLFQKVNGKFVNVPHKIDGNKVTVRTYESGDFELRKVSASFNDISNYFSRENILDLAVRGIVTGVGDQSFAPKDQMSRAEFAAMIARALGLQSSGKNLFKDVPNGKWYTDPIIALAEAGIVQGSGEGYFNPNAKISREEVATILSRIINLELGGSSINSDKTYTDMNQVSNYAKEAVKHLSSLGIFSGYSDGSFAPKNKMIRGEMAKVLSEVLKKINLM